MRVLLLTHRLPYAPNRGDRARAYHLIRTLVPRFEVHVCSLVHDDEEGSHTSEVRALGVGLSAFRVRSGRNYVRAIGRLAGTRPLTHLLLDAPGIERELDRLVADFRPDLVLAYCSGVARFATMPALSRLPLVVDMVDVDSLKWAALGTTARWPMNWIYRREARCLGAFEKTLVARARQTTVVNTKEAAALAALTGSGAIEVVQNGVDVAALRPPSHGRRDAAHVVFCGVMNYAPNVEGVLWFARDVWPAVRRRCPDAVWSIVGSDPAEPIRRLHGDGITVTGTVPDVRDYLWRATASIAPLHTARGVQNKVLEAVAAGLPVVVTPEVAEGLPAQILPACLTGATAEAFASRLIDLLSLPEQERQKIVAGADLSALSWESRLRPMVQILIDAVAPEGSAEP